MPSTFSPSLRIELIGAGEQAGTWGTTTNTNLGTLVEASVAGTVAVSVTTANQALTIANGAADQARNAVLQLTTTTSAPFAVYAPPDPKQYTVYNASAHAATVFNSTVDGNTTAAGTGVTIPAGETMTIWSDGTDFRVQNSRIAGNITGNAATATALQTPRNIGGVSFNGTANIDLPGVNTAGNQNTTGNAASATVLQTARTIGGVSFNGSANINLPGVNTPGNQNTTGSSASTTGNAATATVLQNARTINGTSFNGSANVTVPVNTSQKSDSVAYQVPFVTSVTAGNQDLFTDSAANITYNPSTNTLTTTTFSGALTGNAATATALQTARTIGGVSFNGTANINLPGVNTAGNQNTTGSAATLTTARTIGGVSFNGSANINLPGVNTAGNQNTTGNAATATSTPKVLTTNFTIEESGGKLIFKNGATTIASLSSTGVFTALSSVTGHGTP